MCHCMSRIPIRICFFAVGYVHIYIIYIHTYVYGHILDGESKVHESSWLDVVSTLIAESQHEDL